MDKVFKYLCSLENDTVRPRMISIKGRDVSFSKTCGQVLDSTFSELCERVSYNVWVQYVVLFIKYIHFSLLTGCLSLWEHVGYSCLCINMDAVSQLSHRVLGFFEVSLVAIFRSYSIPAGDIWRHFIRNSKLFRQFCEKLLIFQNVLHNAK